MNINDEQYNNIINTIKGVKNSVISLDTKVTSLDTKVTSLNTKVTKLETVVQGVAENTNFILEVMTELVGKVVVTEDMSNLKKDFDKKLVKLKNKPA